jgi:phage FluMu protein Com
MSDNGLGIEIKVIDNTTYLSGHIDEFVDYGALQKLKFPLKLNLRNIKSINSIGIRKWILYIKNLGDNKVEFHECPPVFIDAVNMIPDVISTHGGKNRVKSVLIPYQCPKCSTIFTIIVSIEKVSTNPKSIRFETVICPHCCTLSEHQIDEHEHFYFLGQG